MKVICTTRRCGWHGTDDQMLSAPHPFDSDETIFGCPKCKQAESLSCACDEPDCWAEVTSGTPTSAGYRNTCFVHAPRNKS